VALSQLIQSFQKWREHGEPLVWVTVIQTEGNTYSKAGEQMLIGPGGQFQGLLSGGCLEGDLLEHAEQVRSSGKPCRLFYDMRDVQADELWGLGLGCDGALTIFMQRLDAGSDYLPFSDLAAWAWEGRTGACALVVASTDEAVPAGASLWQTTDFGGALGLDEQIQEQVLDELGRHAGPALCTIEASSGELELFSMAVPLVPRLLILGAGPDAAPLARIAIQQGWRTSVVDFRQAAIDRFGVEVEQLACVDPAELSSRLDLDAFDAAVLMTHNQARDREYLESLAGAAIPYVGLLGPVSRRDRLLGQVGESAAALAGRVYGPVGLGLGGRGPEAIALSIAAQLQAVFTGVLSSPDQRLEL
jgi:xanthine dehydrogenase accessory factor